MNTPSHLTPILFLKIMEMAMIMEITIKSTTYSSIEKKHILLIPTILIVLASDSEKNNTFLLWVKNHTYLVHPL